MLFTFSPDAYDPAQAPTVRRPRWRTILSWGAANLFNGYSRRREELAVWTCHLCGRHEQPAAPPRRRMGSGWLRSHGRARRLRHVLRPDAGRHVRSERAGDVYRVYDPFRTDVFVDNVALSNPGAATPHPKASICGLSTPQPSTRPAIRSWRPMAALERRRSAPPLLPRHDRCRLRRRRAAIICFDIVDINQPSAEDQGAALNLVRPFRATTPSSCERRPRTAAITGCSSSFRHEAGRAGFAHT